LPKGGKAHEGCMKREMAGMEDGAGGGGGIDRCKALWKAGQRGSNQNKITGNVRAAMSG